MNNEKLLKLPKQVEDITSQLESKASLQQIRDINMPSLDYSNVPVLVFVDDDCTIQAYNNWFRLCKEKNIKITLACITGWMDGSVANPAKTPMSLAQLKEMYDWGCDIASHGVTSAIGIGYATESQARIELEDSQKWLIDNGFTRDKCYRNFVYPGGAGGLGNPQYTLAKKRTRKYYDNAIDAYASTILPELVYDNFAIQRVPSDGVPYSTLKISMDKVIANKGLMIVLSHANNIDVKDGGDYNVWADRYKQLIDYAKANNVAIMTLTEAMKYKGNVLSIGDFDSDCVYVNKNGKSKVSIPTTSSVSKAVINNGQPTLTLTQADIYTTIPFTEFSLNNSKNLISNGTFTCKDAGTYRVKLSIGLAKPFPVGGATINVAIQTFAGTELVRLIQTGVDGINRYQLQGDSLIFLDNDTSIKIGIQSTVANTIFTTGYGQTYLEVEKII